MPSVSPPSTHSRPLEYWLIVGFVTLVVAADLLVSLAPTLGATDAVRVALAALTVLVVPTVVVVAVTRGSLPPVALLVSLPFATLYAYTGLLLPWTQLSFRLGQVGIELALSVPLVGGLIAQLLFDGFTLGQSTLQRALLLHQLTLVAAVVVVVAGVVWSRSTQQEGAHRLTE